MYQAFEHFSTKDNCQIWLHILSKVLLHPDPVIYMTCFQHSKVPCKYHFLPSSKTFMYLYITFPVTAFMSDSADVLNIVFFLSALLLLFGFLLSLGIHHRSQAGQSPTQMKSQRHYLAPTFQFRLNLCFGFYLARFLVCISPTMLPQAAERGSEEWAWKSNSRNKSCSLLSGFRAEVTASLNKGQRSRASLEAVYAKHICAHTHTHTHTHIYTPSSSHFLHNTQRKWQTRYWS